MNQSDNAALNAYQGRIGYTFKVSALLRRALTHSSYGDGRGEVADNERLEFLGDRVLGLLAARFLFDAEQRFVEGDMAVRLNALVCKEACARAARRTGLGEAVLLSKSENRGGGRSKTKILGDTCEAVLAALYLDGGMAEAERFFIRFWGDELYDADGGAHDPKSQLQEWAQGKGDVLPIYTLVERCGPDHAPQFLIEVCAGGVTAQGKAGNKQAAERAAAREILRISGQVK